MIKVFCDKCNQEIPLAQRGEIIIRKVDITFVPLGDKMGRESETLYTERDLCSTCIQRFIDFIDKFKQVPIKES